MWRNSAVHIHCFNKLVKVFDVHGLKVISYIQSIVTFHRKMALFMHDVEHVLVKIELVIMLICVGFQRAAHTHNIQSWLKVAIYMKMYVKPTHTQFDWCEVNFRCRAHSSNVWVIQTTIHCVDAWMGEKLATISFHFMKAPVHADMVTLIRVKSPFYLISSISSRIYEYGGCSQFLVTMCWIHSI